jgi:hypothetical protein
MADGVSFNMVTAPFTDAMGRIDKATDRASMKALRATGRYVQQTAKEQVPVYHGTDPRAVAESGNLKKSIRNAKRITRDGDAFELKVAPWGSEAKGSQIITHGTRGGHAIDSLTAAHLGIVGPSMAKGEMTKGQIRGVMLYRGMQEMIYGYMAYGVLAGQGGMRAKFEEIYDVTFKKAML